MDGAVEVLRLSEVARRAEQHRGVAVVAARVHAAGDRRAVGELVALGDRQRIHVGAQADRAQAASAADRANDAGAADAAVGLDAERLEVAGDERGGTVLLEREFGMGMDVATDRGEPRVMGPDAVDDAHGFTR